MRGIIQIIGINYNSAIKTRETFLDVNLLKHRNVIGHGNQIKPIETEISPLDSDRIGELKNFVVSMLDYYAEVLLKYVEEELYLAVNTEKREAFEIAQNMKLANKLSILERRENKRGGLGI